MNVPPNACDCHMHVYDPRFAALPTWPVAPPHAPVADYVRVQRELGLARAIVVQPNAYGFDNRCTIEAVAALGAQSRGIATVRPDIADSEIERLHAAGMRGARCFMLANGTLSWDDVRAIAARVAAFGWHVQIQLDGRDLPRFAAILSSLPVPVVIDHNGKFLEPVATSHPGFVALLRLLDSGRCWVKLSAPYETSKSGPPRYDDVSTLARALATHAPERCVWASNWPHPGIAPRPSDTAMLDLLSQWVDGDAARKRILVDNPASLYGFPPALPPLM